MSGYDFDMYVHSIARRQPRRLPACVIKQQGLTGSANALSHRIVARALHSWLPWTVTTAGNDKVYKTCTRHFFPSAITKDQSSIAYSYRKTMFMQLSLDQLTSITTTGKLSNIQTYPTCL